MVIARFRKRKTSGYFGTCARRNQSYRRKSLVQYRRSARSKDVNQRLADIRDGNLFINVSSETCGIDKGSDYAGIPYKDSTRDGIAFALSIRVRELERRVNSIESFIRKSGSQAGISLLGKPYYDKRYT